MYVCIEAIVSILAPLIKLVYLIYFIIIDHASTAWQLEMLWMYSLW